MFFFHIYVLFDYSYTIVEVEDHKWGSRDENNNWNGVVGEVVREVCARTHFIQNLWEKTIESLVADGVKENTVTEWNK